MSGGIAVARSECRGVGAVSCQSGHVKVTCALSPPDDTILTVTITLEVWLGVMTGIPENVAFVTGGAQVVGFAVAKRLLAASASVAETDTESEQLKATETVQSNQAVEAQRFGLRAEEVAKHVADMSRTNRFYVFTDRWIEPLVLRDERGTDGITAC